jgi:hypothetical protein
MIFGDTEVAPPSAIAAHGASYAIVFRSMTRENPSATSTVFGGRPRFVTHQNSHRLKDPLTK